ncbi:MAG: glutamate formimidoyltransferase [Acidobacteriia bacterium]|nr:glutamate formimidoyltransferase [Terriglobia bacterium]
MNTLIECVPNFSEGRRTEVVEALIQIIQSVEGATILDKEMDADHNRSVITFIAPKEVVAEAALRAVGKAAELIDLTRHQGAHPRIGATDVLPFIPIEGVTIEECVAISRQVGEALWQRYKIPVYYYEMAATRPDRVNLENIRKGQFEGLREEVKTNPDRRPDVGEAALHPTAGATVVGTRKYLIAYNINLGTSDVSVAKAIAKKIRFSSGGFPFVKAMGVDLKARNLAQVSMNLTDFEQTPIHVVFDAVTREAAAAGIAVVGSEIVGLVPKKALEMTAEHYLEIENFKPDLILENRLAAVLAEKKSTPTQTPPATDRPLLAGCEPFIEAVAAPTPAPGGGSVAAMAATLAAGLGEMVAARSKGKKAAAAFEDELSAILIALAQLRVELKRAIDDDTNAYSLVTAAYKLPKGSEAEKAERQRKIEEALKQATQVPFHVAERSKIVLGHILRLEAIGNKNMISDIRVAREMARTALFGALENVKINLDSMGDRAFVEQIANKIAPLDSALKRND